MTLTARAVSYGLRMDTPPDIEPVTLEQVKEHARIPEDDVGQDALLIGMIRSAVAICEDWTRRALITRQYTLTMDNWPVSEPQTIGLAVNRLPVAGAIELPKPPLQSVISIKTLNADGQPVEWEAANYQVDTISEPGRIAPVKGAVWPTPDISIGGIQIEFVAGYGLTAHEVPEDLRQGIQNLATWLYEMRGDCSEADAKAKGRHASGAAGLWMRHRIYNL